MSLTCHRQSRSRRQRKAASIEILVGAVDRQPSRLFDTNYQPHTNQLCHCSQESTEPRCQNEHVEVTHTTDGRDC
jgi:hypothetical protein